MCEGFRSVLLALKNCASRGMADTYVPDIEEGLKKSDRHRLGDYSSGIRDRTATDRHRITPAISPRTRKTSPPPRSRK
jgi:hypothetical protein